MRLALEVSFIARNFGSVYIVDKIRNFYILKPEIFILREMLFLVYIWAILSALSFCGCSNSETPFDSQDPASGTESLLSKNFVFVKAEGEKVTLGTDDEEASVKDKPSMTVTFDYDFWIGKHEVTCGEMNLGCEGNLPATNVTFFDAVLYANEQSKAAGFDTAYSYTAAFFDGMGSCVGLDGLVFHPEVDAFRLPTEAEWVYAASHGWNPEKSWHSANSNDQLHEVCTSHVDSLGLCDMAGNAMEWVGDLCVPFQKTTVENFVGGLSEGGLEERVLKGGSFRNNPESIQLYRRGDVYTVTSSTKSSYVGFRLAFGKIPEPVYLDVSGNKEKLSFSLLAGAKSLQGILGRSFSRFLFWDDASGSLVQVKFVGDKATYTEIETGVRAYHPDISFDGRYVAFCTGLEGVSGKSELYVYRLDGTAGAPVKLEVASAAIPRWRVTEDGDTVIVYVTDAGDNRNDSAFFAASTWQVKFEGGEFGKPEKLYEGAYHDGVSRDGRLAVTGARLLRAQLDGEDATWYDAQQACNASLNRSDNRTTIFLDFGSKKADSSYGVHERILLADSSGKVSLSMSAPDGYSFDHTEWVVGSDSLFVATLVNANGAHQKIVLANPYTGKMFELAEGEELWHPAYWIFEDFDSTLALDSLGMYYSTNGQVTHYLAEKMPLFWNYHDSAEVVCLGNSHMQAGVYPGEMKHFAINLSTTPCDMHCIRYMYENYVTNHVKQLKYLVIGLDLDLWGEYDDGMSMALNMGDAPGYQYDIAHEFWKDGVDKAFVEWVDQLGNALGYSPDIMENRGWAYFLCIPDWGAGEDGYAEVVGDSTWSDDPTRYESNYAELERILNLAEEQGIYVVGIVFPISPYYRNTGSYGRHGMRRSTAQMLMDRLGSISSEHKNFVLMDENRMGNHDYTGNDATDYDHLCFRGARTLSRRLDSLLNTLE